MDITASESPNTADADFVMVLERLSELAAAADSPLVRYRIIGACGDVRRFSVSLNAAEADLMMVRSAVGFTTGVNIHPLLVNSI